MPISLLLLTAVCLQCASAALAHNGRLAFAPAVEGIVVDGDLSDWPDHLPRYPVANAAFGDALAGPADLSATFRVAYSATGHRLLVSVEVEDESLVVPESVGDWRSADGCELYLDASHGREPGYQLSLWGRQRSVLGGSRWRELRTRLGDGSRGDVYQVESALQPGRRVYEWSVDVGGLGTGRVRLRPGIDLAFDVAVADRDADGSFTWMSWGPHTGKLESKGRLGDLIVLGGGASFAEAISGAGDLLGRVARRAEEDARRSAAFLTFLAGALLAVTLLHLLLFAFQRESLVNLYYALFTGVTALAIGLAYGLPSATLEQGAGHILSLWLVVVYATSLLLLYTQFHGRITRGGRLLLAGLGYAAVTRYLLPGGWPPESPYATVYWLAAAGANAAFVAAFVTIGRLVFGALRRRREEAWSVGVSFLVCAGSAGFVVYRLTRGADLHPLLLAGVLLPMAAMSWRLARSVAGVHRNLARRYDEVETLSRQLRERNRELEQANVRIRQQSRQVEEADRLKSDFLARMSHDLRTPLNAIIGYTRILLRRLEDAVDPRQYRNLTNIRISADNLLALINDILDLSRIESGRTEIHVEEVDLRRLATDCVAAVAPLARDGVELVTELNGSPRVRTDEDRVRRVLMNLLGNAVKYTEQGRIALRLDLTADGVTLIVADTGVGIPAGDLPHVFDEFRQVERRDRKREGSGLGLAIARRSVELLGGAIDVDSTVGVGSTFTVRLPASVPDDDGSRGQAGARST